MPEITHAKIHFNDQGTPVASDFDDVYFSNDGGMAETDYVFLQQNGLPQRWQTHDCTAFHIIETGFGTGANFLLSWLRFRQHRQHYPHAHCQRLYFTSCEKFPLSLSDLRRALAAHTELPELCQLLLEAYPICVGGCHRLCFDNGSVVLDLWFGDVNSVLPQCQSPADAIFLDGFAPSKNPDMWQDTLFENLARLSHSHTTVATFTAAGLVKRGLQQAGFTVKKVKGFGRKREMLTATVAASNVIRQQPVQNVVIVGGGIASICTALALTQRGVTVTLVCEDARVAAQASQNRQGAVYPNLHASLTDDSQLHVQAFLYARRFYQHWQHKLADFAMDWCGLLHLATNAQLQLRQQKLLQNKWWPQELVREVDATTATELAGVQLQHSGIYFPLAGWLNPQQFCQQALHYLTQQASFSVVLNCQVNQLEHSGTFWQVHCNGQTLHADTLILACGSKLANFRQTAALPLNKIRGQVSHVQHAPMAPLKTVLCHKGYITPQWQGLHCVGATFDRDATEAILKHQDDTENLQLVEQQLQQPDWFNGAAVVSAAAAFRATLPDHLPVAGPMLQANKLYIIGGLGARGIMLSPLLAEVLACQICHEPLPLSQRLTQRLSPNRFN